MKFSHKISRIAYESMATPRDALFETQRKQCRDGAKKRTAASESLMDTELGSLYVII